MGKLLSISSNELCRILSSEKNLLNSFELAIFRALEDANSVEEFLAIKEQACISNDYVQVQTSGKILRL